MLFEDEQSYAMCCVERWYVDGATQLLHEYQQ